MHACVDDASWHLNELGSSWRGGIEFEGTPIKLQALVTTLIELDGQNGTDENAHVGGTRVV